MVLVQRRVPSVRVVAGPEFDDSCFALSGLQIVALLFDRFEMEQMRNSGGDPQVAPIQAN